MVGMELQLSGIFAYPTWVRSQGRWITDTQLYNWGSQYVWGYNQKLSALVFDLRLAVFVHMQHGRKLHQESKVVPLTVEVGEVGAA